MKNCQTKEGNFYHIENKNDRMIYSGVSEKSEIESLDYSCVEQNHQINLPDSFESGRLAVSKNLSEECSVKSMKKRTQNSDLNRFDNINYQNINSQRSIFSKNIAENMKHSLKIRRTNKIGLTSNICVNIEPLTPSFDNGEAKGNLNGSSDNIDKNDIVENKPNFLIENDLDLTEPDLTKFYKNKHKFKKEEFQHYIDLGKRDSYDDFINGN